MKTLLRSLPQPEYPTDYLTARIRGRRTDLIIDWQPYLSGQQSLPGASEKTAHTIFSAELYWLYRQMNRRLRRLFHNIFLYYELRNLSLALRFMTGRQKTAAIELVKTSLLSEEILLILQKHEACLPFLKDLAEFIEACPDIKNQLKKNQAEQDPKICEILVFTMFLQKMALQESHPLIDLFIKLQIDFHNSLNLLKHNRWLRQHPERFIAGGNKNIRFLTRSINKKYGEAGLTPQILIDATMFFLKELHRQLHRIFISYDETGLILEYIWLQHIESVNLGILRHSEELSKEMIASELIR